MQLEEVKIMRGPNYYSATHNRIIVATLTAPDTPATPALIREIEIRLTEAARTNPSATGQLTDFLIGANIRNVAELTTLLTLKLQQLAGCNIMYAETQTTSAEGVYRIICEYESGKAGKYAVQVAVNVVNNIEENKPHDVAADLKEIQELFYSEYLGPSTTGITSQAIARGIPVIGSPRSPFIQLGYGSRQKRISAALTSQTPSIGVDIAANKDLTKELLDSFNIPVPKGTIVYNKYELKDALDKLGFPVVIKPLDSNQGKGASINVKDWPCALKSFLGARRFSRAVIVEQFILGHDYRLLVVNGKMVAAALRTPACVTGDGNLTIQQLIEKVNLDPRRGEGHEKVLTQIKVDDMTMRILNDKGYTLDFILPYGEILYLKDTANLSTGGTSSDVTDIVHPENIFIAEQIAAISGLDIVGIDMMTTDIAKPLRKTGGAVIEINAAPGLRMHTHPAEGKPRNPGKAIVDMLFPPGTPYSIPIVAVTGTNGKTTTVRLIAHMAALAGNRVGFTNTDGIYIHNHLGQKGDCSGPVSAEFVLKNPSVDFAVLETARGGVLRSGLCFNFCHAAVVTNISADHLGLKGINTLEEMADVKSVIPRTVLPDGYAVLNAADDLVYRMHKNLKCRIALFAPDANNERLVTHIRNKDLACTTIDDYVVLFEDGRKHIIEHVKNIPITYGGRADFMTENVLASVLAAFATGIPLDVIHKALLTFEPSPEQTPGRLNIFKIRDFEVMIDYAHNPAGLTALGRFLRKVDSPYKVGVFTAVGDRREEDIIEMGRIAAQLFDKIIIRLDDNLRGATPEYLVETLKKGIELIIPQKEVEVIPDEAEASRSAIEHATPGSFITLCTDKIDRAFSIVRSYQQQENQRLNGSAVNGQYNGIGLPAETQPHPVRRTADTPLL
jgi:cyanophycin synthetase